MSQVKKKVNGQCLLKVHFDRKNQLLSHKISVAKGKMIK